MEVDGEEEESERRNNAVEIYMLDVNIRNSLQEEIELGEEYLETLKEILEANEEELRLIYLITSRVELVGEIVKPLEKDRSCFWNKSYMGDSQLLVREMFKYARDHQVKVIMATNRPGVLDPALLRPGRIDKKIEIPLPNQDSRLRILKIHASGITKQGEIDYERVAKLSEGFNGAYICTEAAMLAIPADRDYVVPNDFIKAVRKLESSAQSTINADFQERVAIET